MLFYCYKHIKKEHFNIILALTVVFCASFLVHHKGIYAVENYHYVFNRGILRALLCMGLGYFVYNLYCDKLANLSEIKFNFAQKLAVTALEIYLTVFVVQNLLIRSGHIDNRLLLVLLFTILLICLLLGQGYLSKLLNNNFSTCIGKYVYSIMLTHETILFVFRDVINPKITDFIINNPHTYFFGVLAIVILFGFLVHHCFEKPVGKFLRSKFCR